jgi:hypothetical protein
MTSYEIEARERERETQLSSAQWLERWPQARGRGAERESQPFQLVLTGWFINPAWKKKMS